MDSSQMQKPQRAPGDIAAVGRLFLLELSDDRIVTLNPDGSDRKVIVTGHIGICLTESPTAQHRTTPSCDGSPRPAAPITTRNEIAHPEPIAAHRC
jgi:hypothetical protein